MKYVCDEKFTVAWHGRAENYQNSTWSDKVIAKIKWWSFLTHNGVY